MLQTVNDDTRPPAERLERLNRSAKHELLEDALRFLQDRIGPFLRPGAPPGSKQGAVTLAATYPKKTKAVDGRPNRIGAGSFAAILVDARQVVLVDGWSTDFTGVLRSRGAIVAASDKDTSLIRAVFEWAASAERVFPFAAVMPSKASVANENSLLLSYSPEFARVCSPGMIVEFDAPYVTDIRRRLREKAIEPKTWRAACRRQAQRISAVGPETPREINAHNKALNADVEIFGSALLSDLPSLGSGDYTALSALFIDKEPLTW